MPSINLGRAAFLDFVTFGLGDAARLALGEDCAADGEASAAEGEAAGGGLSKRFMT